MRRTAWFWMLVVGLYLGTIGASALAVEKGDPAKGKVNYQTFCAVCHGQQGKGDGPSSAALNPKPADQSDGNYMNKLSTEHLVKVIKQGGAAVGKSPLMPPWGASLSDQQIADVIAYVRSLANPPYKGN